MVWPSDVSPNACTNRCYETALQVREEAGTPGVIESIRCGLAFHARNLVGPKTIEELEGKFAVEAVRRLQENKIWVMGDVHTEGIMSPERLSITSFNVWCSVKGTNSGMDFADVPVETLCHPDTQKPLMLHPHFVAALLNDVYGIQARSGCACAGPLSFRLFGPRYPFMTQEAIDQLIDLADKNLHSLKPGFCRVNFNYFIDEEEFDFILQAIQQIAEHGWKLLPLYALCLQTGQYWYNGVEKNGDKYESFNRFDAVRTLNEVEMGPEGITWHGCKYSEADRRQYLKEALQIYDKAPKLVRDMLFRFRDMRRRDVPFPEHLQKYRFFVLGSEVLPHLGISETEVAEAMGTSESKDPVANPMITSFPKHQVATPMYTFNRPRG